MYIHTCLPPYRTLWTHLPPSLTPASLQDIVDTLQSLGMIKYWKGTHLIHADPRIAQEHLAKIPSQVSIEVDPACLHWQPMPTAPSRKRP